MNGENKNICGCFDINSQIEKKSSCGGSVKLPVGEYVLDKPVIIDTPCLRLVGESWYYPSDPNGVFESGYGTKLKPRNMDFPAVEMGRSRTIGGASAELIGIQGNIRGMDTRGFFSTEHPERGVGFFFGSQRTDQCRIDRVTCCGLAAGVSAAYNAELDACTIENFNFDGCDVGVYFAPEASYYVRFCHGVSADNPSYGFLLDNESGRIRSLQVYDVHFVRNAGDISAEKYNKIPHAAIYFRKANSCILRNCIIEDAGLFWYYNPDAEKNSERIPQKRKVCSVLIEGNANIISDNIIRHCSAEGIVVRGKGNVLMNNVTDGDVVIHGEGNTVNGIAFLSDSARLIIADDAVGTVIFNVPDDRIVRNFR